MNTTSTKANTTPRSRAPYPDPLRLRIGKARLVDDIRAGFRRGAITTDERDFLLRSVYAARTAYDASALLSDARRRRG